MKTKTRLDESTLSRLAYQSYLMGRIAAAVPPESPVWANLSLRYAEPCQSPVEPYCFAVGLTSPSGDVLSPQALLDAVHAELEPARPRRPRRPDMRWGQR